MTGSVGLIKDPSIGTASVWTPPPSGTIKINADGAFKEGRMSPSMVVRDEFHRFIFCATEIEDSGSPILAESRAFEMAARWSMAHPNSSIIIEGDSCKFVVWVNSVGMLGEWVVRKEVEICKLLLRDRENVTIAFSPRGTNGVAHSLASYSLRLLVTDCWDGPLPSPFLMDHLFADLANHVAPSFPFD